MMMMNRGKEIRDVRVESFDFEIEFLSLFRNLPISPPRAIRVQQVCSSGIQIVGEQDQGKRCDWIWDFDWNGLDSGEAVLGK